MRYVKSSFIFCLQRMGQCDNWLIPDREWAKILTKVNIKKVWLNLQWATVETAVWGCEYSYLNNLPGKKLASHRKMPAGENRFIVCSVAGNTKKAVCCPKHCAHFLRSQPHIRFRANWTHGPWLGPHSFHIFTACPECEVCIKGDSSLTPRHVV